uniref:Uncharacterized protein n=1 Tax=Aegilops tauschii subsp. strangulata TaxID=200361 RepID=A0A453I213_AEGTS
MCYRKFRRWMKPEGSAPLGSNNLSHVLLNFWRNGKFHSKAECLNVDI